MVRVRWWCDNAKRKKWYRKIASQLPCTWPPGAALGTALPLNHVCTRTVAVGSLVPDGGVVPSRWQVNPSQIDTWTVQTSD